MPYHVLVFMQLYAIKLPPMGQCLHHRSRNRSCGFFRGCVDIVDMWTSCLSVHLQISRIGLPCSSRLLFPLSSCFSTVLSFTNGTTLLSLSTQLSSIPSPFLFAVALCHPFTSAPWITESIHHLRYAFNPRPNLPLPPFHRLGPHCGSLPDLQQHHSSIPHWPHWHLPSYLDILYHHHYQHVRVSSSRDHHRYRNRHHVCRHSIPHGNWHRRHSCTDGHCGPECQCSILSKALGYERSELPRRSSGLQPGLQREAVQLVALVLASSFHLQIPPPPSTASPLLGCIVGSNWSLSRVMTQGRSLT